MLLYLVKQAQFCEGNFGDLESAPDKIIGVYSSRQLAEEKISTVPQPVFKTEYGVGTEQCVIDVLTLDA